MRSKPFLGELCENFTKRKNLSFDYKMCLISFSTKLSIDIVLKSNTVPSKIWFHLLLLCWK